MSLGTSGWILWRESESTGVLVPIRLFRCWRWEFWQRLQCYTGCNEKRDLAIQNITLVGSSTHGAMTIERGLWILKLGFCVVKCGRKLVEWKDDNRRPVNIGVGDETSYLGSCYWYLGQAPFLSRMVYTVFTSVMANSCERAAVNGQVFSSASRRDGVENEWNEYVSEVGFSRFAAMEIWFVPYNLRVPARSDQPVS